MQTDTVDAVTSQTATRFALSIPPLKTLTSKEELALARAAFDRHPEDAKIRERLLRLLALLDHFDEALTIVEAYPGGNVGYLFLLSTVLLSREQPEDNLRALSVCQQALDVCSEPRKQAEIKAQLAKAHHRLGQYAEAKRQLTEALSIEPNEKDAYKRLFYHLLEVEQDAESALTLAETNIARGIVHARVLGSQVLALARLRRIEEARQAEGAEQFLVEIDPALPPGWDDREAFHAALSKEALQHPDMRYDRYGTASAETWRLDEPALLRTRIFPQLQKLIQREVEAYVAHLTGINHPFAAAVPANARLRNWCVITEGDGYETYHVHQNGWLSGVYYIHVQDHIANGTGLEGCISFGLPESMVGEEASRAYGEKIVRPHSGLMMMFPSHMYHRTFPHHGEGRRICYAFDIIPVDEPA